MLDILIPIVSNEAVEILFQKSNEISRVAGSEQSQAGHEVRTGSTGILKYRVLMIVGIVDSCRDGLAQR